MSIRVLRGLEAASVDTGQPARSATGGGSAALAMDPAQELASQAPPPEEFLAQAFQDGFAKGRDSLRAEFEARAAEITQQVGQTVCTLARERPRLRSAAESDVVKLALTIARRVIRRELSIDPMSIHGIVRVAIDTINDREMVRVRVHSDLLAAVQGKLRDSHLSHVEVVTDPSFQPGDIVFQTDQGELDCSIESQLKEIDLGIADRLGR